MTLINSLWQGMELEFKMSLQSSLVLWDLIWWWWHEVSSELSAKTGRQPEHPNMGWEHEGSSQRGRLSSTSLALRKRGIPQGRGCQGGSNGQGNPSSSFSCLTMESEVDLRDVGKKTATGCKEVCRKRDESGRTDDCEPEEIWRFRRRKGRLKKKTRSGLAQKLSPKDGLQGSCDVQFSRRRQVSTSGLRQQPEPRRRWSGRMLYFISLSTLPTLMYFQLTFHYNFHKHFMSRLRYNAGCRRNSCKIAQPMLVICTGNVISSSSGWRGLCKMS